MIFNRRTNANRHLGRLQWVALIILLGFASMIAFFIWHSGTETVLGIPMQINLISLLLPVLCGGLIFWFARKHDQLSWQHDDDR